MLKDWIVENKLNAEFVTENIINIPQVGMFLLLHPREAFFDDRLKPILSQNEIDTKCDYYLFEFGGIYYYFPKNSNKVQFNEFKYLGKCVLELDPIPFLGIHGGFEILNGSRKYPDWVVKAKFYQYQTLGICERNTLAGTYRFNAACLKGNIKPIIGEEVVVKSSTGLTFIIKLYCIDSTGWLNLLQINKQIRVINNNFIEEKVLFEHTEGLICILSYSRDLYELSDIKRYASNFKYCYFQIDTVAWESETQDQKYLLYLKDYLDNYFNLIQPILINDAYYLDQDDYKVKSILNKVGDLSHQSKSSDQYFKSADDNFRILCNLFKDGDSRLYDLFERCIENLFQVEQLCTFIIKSDRVHLPVFTLPPDFTGTKEDFFLNLIAEGFEKKILDKVDDIEKYYNRIQLEYEVICEGGFIDYFLISWDILRFCKENDILIGIGRGSAAGSLICLCLGVTEIDPFKYDLLFERFMNRGRMKGSLPDLDLDFQASRRNEVKEYIERIYGKDFVCSIGTYTTMQLKAAFRDILKLAGNEGTTVDHYSKTLTLHADHEGGEWNEIFLVAMKNPQFKDFVKKNTEGINQIRLISGQPKSESIHPCGMLIMPKDENIFTQIPVKKIENELVSEWEYRAVAEMGYLKQDILGVQQLDKFKFILDAIKADTGEEIDLYNIPLDDKEVYRYCQNGWNSDVFHFGSFGLTNYSKLVKPENLEELIAMIALFRPGVMGIGAHLDFVELKFKRKEPEYDYLLKPITEKTFGIYVYQEQIMQACQVLGGFTLVEADNIRKAMVYRDPVLMLSYKEKFVSNAVKQGCDEEEASSVFNKLETFAGYGFNKCLAGSERLYRVGINKTNKSSYNPTIGEMYKLKNDRNYAKLNGKEELYWKYKGKGYGVGFSLNESGKLVKNKIKDIRYEGLRDIFKITLNNDASICATDNHKFPTNHGEKLLRDLVPGEDKLFFKEGYLKEDTSLCVSCHKKEHYKLGRVKMGGKGLLTELVGIKEITYVGKEEVYDVEMEDPYHTFTTDKGIVTCNSHSVAYAILGYCSQWLKVNYPFQYWKVTFSFIKDEDIIPFTNEINLTSSGLKIKTPSINHSQEDFNFYNKSLYWSFTKIKGVGDVAVKQLLEERQNNGHFFSLSEFLKRRNKSKVNKTVVEALIYSGAFDEVEDIINPRDRFKLLNQYYKSENIKQINYSYNESDSIGEDHWWLLKQRSLIGIAYFNWKQILIDNDFTKDIFQGDLQSMEIDKDFYGGLSIGGVIVEIIIRRSKKGDFAQLQIDTNCELNFVTLWSDVWDKKGNGVEGKEGQIILLSKLVIKWDKYKGANVLQSTNKTKLKIL